MLREVELKYKFLNQNSFKKIKDHFSNNSSTAFQQKNLFFDTSALNLYRNNIIIRIREANNRFMYTLKANINNENSLHEPNNLLSNFEFEFYLSKYSSRDPKILLKKCIQENSENNSTRLYLIRRIEKIIQSRCMYNVGHFTNKRNKVCIRMNEFTLNLELDETDFGNNDISYEAEIEIPEHLDPVNVNNKMITIFKNIGVEFFQSESKSRKFFKKIQKLS